MTDLTRPRTLLAFAAAAGLTALSGADSTIDTFDPGANLGNWSLGGGGIDPAGGNPGPWLHNANADTFAPILRSAETPSPFVGDYRAMGVTSISLDARTDDRNFGDPLGFEMSILLRDTKGTPSVDDDDYAYFVGPQCPLIGEGWIHYDFNIPSASTDAVPAGWTGGWAGDGENFRPGVDWNDVITSVDKVEVWWINPAFFAIFATWDAGADNVAICVEAACSADLNGDGTVGPADLAALLDAWGPNPGNDADLNGDGDVGPPDLAALLDAWGEC